MFIFVSSITLALETASEAIILNKLVFQSCNSNFSLDNKLLIGWFIHVLRVNVIFSGVARIRI